MTKGSYRLLWTAHRESLTLKPRLGWESTLGDDMHKKYHMVVQLCEAMEVPGSASGVFIFECIASEASTANPLKKRAFRRPMDQVSVLNFWCSKQSLVCHILAFLTHTYSLWTSTTQERSATCSSTARTAARPSTITFRSLFLDFHAKKCSFKLLLPHC